MFCNRFAAVIPSSLTPCRVARLPSFAPSSSFPQSFAWGRSSKTSAIGTFGCFGPMCRASASDTSLGFGRIVGSEIEVPNMLADMVSSG